MRNKRVFVLTTGGTIGTYVDKSGIAHVSDKGKDLLDRLKNQGVEIESKSILQKGSADLVPSDWQKIAEAVASVIKTTKDLDGVVIMHGTDTMHYSAAALSFMLQNLGIPIVLTGSMVSGSNPKGDAMPNLKDAILVASQSDIAEVSIVFSAVPNGTSRVIIRGCRARKMDSSALNAFVSTNVPPIGFVKGGLITYSEVKHSRRAKRTLKVSTDLDANVVYLKQNPGLTRKMLERFLKGASGAVIEGTGVGHIREDLHETISRFGKPVVVSTQAIYGGEKLGSYDLGKKMLAIPNLIPAHDMNSEAALVKLMWALKQKGRGVRSTMLKDFSGEISASVPSTPISRVYK